MGLIVLSFAATTDDNIQNGYLLNSNNAVRVAIKLAPDPPITRSRGRSQQITTTVNCQTAGKIQCQVASEIKQAASSTRQNPLQFEVVERTRTRMLRSRRVIIE